MHLVTKILIVFAALFAVLLAALSTAFSFNAQAIRDSVGAAQAEKAAAIVALNEAQTAAQNQTASAKQSAEAANSQLTAVTNENKTLSNERSKLQADLKSAQLDAARFSTESSGKDARLQTLEKLVAAVSAENKTLRDEYVGMSKREVELLARLSELESQYQVSVQNLRAVQEQMAAMKEASTKTAAATSTGGTEITTGPLITARVSKTTLAESGDELAFISAGQSAGVKVGQRLSIIRGGNFIASMVVTAVDTNEAAGRIDTLGRAVKVQADDVVLSRVN